MPRVLASSDTAGVVMAETVVVFDFDRTLIDGDSDNWVVTQMGLSDLFDQLRSTLPWNSLMDRMMEELHSRGKVGEDIAECLRDAPLHPQIASAVKFAHTSGCDLRIVSDANNFFIEKILEHHGLLDCFSEIYSNPAVVDEDGRLRIFPFNDSTIYAHGCNLCPPNMCKGIVVDGIRRASSPQNQNQNGGQKFIYIGDGRNDFCPTLPLKDRDHVMPRMNYPLWNCINNSTLVKASVHEWSNAEEFPWYPSPSCRIKFLHMLHCIPSWVICAGSPAPYTLCIMLLGRFYYRCPGTTTVFDTTC